MPDVIGGAALTRAGNTLPLPDLPLDPVLGAGSPVVAEVVERLDGGDRYATFLHPGPDTEAGGLLRVTALDCSEEGAEEMTEAAKPGKIAIVRAVPTDNTSVLKSSVCILSPSRTRGEAEMAGPSTSPLSLLFARSGSIGVLSSFA